MIGFGYRLRLWLLARSSRILIEYCFPLPPLHLQQATGTARRLVQLLSEVEVALLLELILKLPNLNELYYAIAH